MKNLEASQIALIIISIVLTLFIIFTVVITPILKKKRLEKEMTRRAKLYKKVRKGHECLLSSGILGQIVDIQENIYFIKIAEKTIVKVNKEYIAGIFDPEIAKQEIQKKKKENRIPSKSKIT